MDLLAYKREGCGVEKEGGLDSRKKSFFNRKGFQLVLDETKGGGGKSMTS